LSRDISPELALALTQTHVNSALMAEFDFDSGTLGMWTGYGTLVWGEKEFFGGGNLVSVSPIRETQDLQANAVTFNLAGVSQPNVALALQENLQNRPCRLYAATTATSVALATENDSGAILMEGGEAILLESTVMDEPYLFWSGLMNVMQGKARIPLSELSLSAENILIWLRRTRESRYTDEDQKAKYPGDRFFEFIAQLQDKEIVW
jgi:hypothetical protein